ncbi:uncharacterized protein LOC135708209 [Ochlerotatus camptorhynchus]|uniref:uncharacterized protein LOC135708209 n=1 Tax=Ochlerotatus camptorhynchus TaxID=644619 RepID=UPI0031D57C4F
MADMFSNNLDKIFESINSTMRIANEYGTPEQQNIKVYSALTEKLVEIEQNFNKHNKALQESSKEITLEEFDRRYQSSLTAGKSNVKQLKRYKDYIAHARSILSSQDQDDSNDSRSDEDEEMVQMDEAIIDTDPITKRPLEVPVRNIRCNHVYEKSAIEQMIKTNPRTRCPVMGCAAAQFVTLADLQEDEKLRQKLKMQRRTKNK